MERILSNQFHRSLPEVGTTLKCIQLSSGFSEFESILTSFLTRLHFDVAMYPQERKLYWINISIKLFEIWLPLIYYSMKFQYRATCNSFPEQNTILFCLYQLIDYLYSYPIIS